jgi:hypothetical protein
VADVYHVLARLIIIKGRQGGAEQGLFGKLSATKDVPKVMNRCIRAAWGHVALPVPVDEMEETVFDIAEQLQASYAAPTTHCNRSGAVTVILANPSITESHAKQHCGMKNTGSSEGESGAGHKSTTSHYNGISYRADIRVARQLNGYHDIDVGGKVPYPELWVPEAEMATWKQFVSDLLATSTLRFLVKQYLASAVIHWHKKMIEDATAASVSDPKLSEQITSFITHVRASAGRAGVSDEMLERWQERWRAAYDEFNLPPLSRRLTADAPTLLRNLSINLLAHSTRLGEVEKGSSAQGTQMTEMMAEIGQVREMMTEMLAEIRDGRIAGGGMRLPHPQPQPQPQQPRPQQPPEPEPQLQPPTKRSFTKQITLTADVGGEYVIKTADALLSAVWLRWYKDGWYRAPENTPDKKMMKYYGQLVAMANAIHAGARTTRGEPAVEVTAYPQLDTAQRDWNTRMSQLALAVERDVLAFVTTGYPTRTGKPRTTKAEGLKENLKKIPVSKWPAIDALAIKEKVNDTPEGGFKFGVELSTILGKRKESRE